MGSFLTRNDGFPYEKLIVSLRETFGKIMVPLFYPKKTKGRVFATHPFVLVKEFTLPNLFNQKLIKCFDY